MNSAELSEDCRVQHLNEAATCRPLLEVRDIRNSSLGSPHFELILQNMLVREMYVV